MTPDPDRQDDLRFGFGRNWMSFQATVDDGRIEEAERSLKEMLGVEDLKGRTFLDIGSGSGLFSLAAIRLKAERVVSFDFDDESVRCTREMQARHEAYAENWEVMQGSVLDRDFLTSLGDFDVVYSWGVLHHTGDLRRALQNAAARVRPGGTLFISIYNDQGWRSVAWRRVKRAYNEAPVALRPLFVFAFLAPRETARLLIALGRRDPGGFIRRWTKYRQLRGMSRWHDAVDWVGGYPFEVARPDEMLDWGSAHGLRLQRLITRTVGCNEYVFQRADGD